MFEVAVAGTIGKYFFRADDGSEDGVGHGVVRATTSLVAAFSKSFGSSVIGGLVQFIVEAVLFLRNRVDTIAKNNLMWFVFPVKLIFMLISFALTLLAAFFDNAIKYSLSYVGLYGCSFGEGWQKTRSLFRMDYLMADLAANGTSDGMVSFLLIVMCFNVSWALTPAALNLSAKYIESEALRADPFSAWIVPAYIALSMFWTFFGAVRSIMICTFEDLKCGRGSISALPVSGVYKDMLATYLKKDLGVNVKKLY